MLGSLSGWGAVGIAALGCSIFVGLVVLSIAAVLKLEGHSHPGESKRRREKLHVALMGYHSGAGQPSAPSRALGPTSTKVLKVVRMWLTREHILSDDAGAWIFTERWLGRRRTLYRAAIGLAVATSAGVIAAAVASIQAPLLFDTHGAVLFWSFSTLLASSLVLIVISTVPWHFGSIEEWNARQLDYMFNRHPLRFLGLLPLGFIALGIVIVVGLTNQGPGGNTEYFQIGKHYFESGGDCYVCPSTRITRQAFLGAVRAQGIEESFGFLIASWVCILLGTMLHRARDPRVMREAGMPVSS